MAAESIEKKAKEMGYRVKVETRGSGGAKNILTADDIQNADGIMCCGRYKSSYGSIQRKTRDSDRLLPMEFINRRS